VSRIAVRLARPDELGAVAELRWRSIEESRGTPAVPLEAFVARFVSWAEQHGATHRCVVAVRDGVVIGTAWLASLPRPPSPRAMTRFSGDVQSVYVVPEERDRGLGGRLIEAVLSIARELGFERVTVHSSERAIPMYARRGFAVSERYLQADFADQDEHPGEAGVLDEFRASD
jgi:GNAT superfamily N-acetyltransferase